MSEAYCQSCGMPLGESGELRGTEADGQPSADYCKYCYGEGHFLYECTMAQMIDTCVPLMAESGMDPAQARSWMEQQFPQLKRWRR